MEKAAFEEKSYEGPLNTQLLFNNHIYWPPGQVFEEHFGIDSALNAQNPNFWLLFGLSSPMNGVIVDDFNWGYIWRRIDSKKQLPTFNLNLFVQAKRPEYLYGRNNQYARNGIKGSYYRFEVMEHQQKALERLATKLGNKALIVYACPVFHSNNDLFRHIHNHSLVENSTFVRATNMKNHKRWVFDEPGTIGLACSEIERIKDEPFSVIIQNMLNETLQLDSIPEIALKNLIHIESIIVKEFSDLRDRNEIAEEFFRRDSLLRDQFERAFNEPKLRSYIRIISMTVLLNLNWYVFG
ncbi:hypothetical protein ACTQ5K_00670 [Niallia sp. Sow4_A1]|uniref:Uncharacterized protein n=1 Tax=Niallia hominis TaxID=3133173 RepID=A0ABV1EXP2_9BACI